MKLLIFAHIPPPHHGQSYMVKLMLDGLGGDCRTGAHPPGPVQCYHVNARVSDNMEDIGAFRFGKLLLILRYCFEAIWCRFRYGVRTFYYVPAPGKRAAVYRDWIVMLLCRPFFSRLIYHWHAVGLGDWLQKEGYWWERRITHWLLGKPYLSMALAIPSIRDALWFRSRHVAILPNGVADPFSSFAETIRPLRMARLQARRKLLAGAVLSAEDREATGRDPDVFRVLFLANAIREKGLFDTMDGVILANAKLRAANSPLRIHLVITGSFYEEAERAEFDAKMSDPEVQAAIEYAGFVTGEQKAELLRTSDCLCFPTYYHAEGFPLVILEAMAAGMDVVTTRWRAIPEQLPPDHPGFVPPRDPAAVAGALEALFEHDAVALRGVFERQFTETRHVEMLAKVLSTAA